MEKEFEIDYYTLFEISATATTDEIRKAYKLKVIYWHPDRNPDPKSKEIFHQIHKAYEVLSDEKAKQAYDAVIKAKLMRMKKDNELDSKKKRMKEELLAREAEHKAKKHRTTVYSATDEEKLRKFYEEQEARVKRESWRKFREEAIIQPEEHITEEDLDPGAAIKISWDSNKGNYNEIKLRTLFSKYGSIDYIQIKQKKAYIAFKNSYSAYVALEQETGDIENPLKINWGRKNKLKPETAATKKNGINKYC